MDVGSILADKGSRVLTIRPDAPLLLAAQHMRAMGVGALVVSSDGARVDGLLSERDVVVAFAEHPELLAHRKVSEVMLRNPVVARPDEDLDKIRWVFLGGIACARRSIRVLTPYFLPDQAIATAFNVAAMRSPGR